MQAITFVVDCFPIRLRYHIVLHYHATKKSRLKLFLGPLTGVVGIYRAFVSVSKIPILQDDVVISVVWYPCDLKT